MKIPIPAYPKQRLGQNFLRDANVVSKIVGFIDPKPGDFILEIGGGTGALTAPLAAAAINIIVVELDPTLTPHLQAIPGAGVLNQDIRDVRICELHPGAKWRVVGNLPYYISTSILTALLRQRDCIGEMFLMFQEEVARRILAHPGDSEYGMLSVLAQHYCEIESGFKISRNSFSPKPEIESRVLRFLLKKEELAEYEDFAALVADAFSQRRKKLRNNLLRTRNIAPERLDEVLGKLGIALDARAENLVPKQYEGLLRSGALTRKKGLKPDE